MATDNNVYELIDEYVAFGQVMKNVYFYQIGSALSFDAQNLVDDFIATVLPDILATQPVDTVHQKVSARNLFNAVETGETLLSSAGTLSGTGENVSPFVAAGFTLARTTGATRSGKKRVFVGGEPYINGSVWTGAILTALSTLATQMAEIITVTLVQRWFPVIVKRILVTVGEYRLPATLAEATVNPVAAGLSSSLVTTQNSRKIGVGE